MSIEVGDELKMVVTLAMPGLTVAQNVFYARYTAGGSQGEAAITDDLFAWSEDMYANVLSIMVDAVSISEVSVSVKVSAVPLVFEEIGTVAGTQVGTETGDMVANGVAMVMRVGTSALKSLARKYLAGFSEGFSIGTAWTAGALAAGASFLFDWIAGPATVGVRNYEAGIVSTKDGLFKTFDPVGVLSSIPGYQRRRKPGVGI